VEPLTFDSHDAGEVEASVSRMCSRTHIGATGRRTDPHITRRLLTPSRSATSSSVTSPQALRRAVAFIDDNAELDLTVSDIARGFPSPGRFAEEYRATYGDLPSNTLRGARCPP